MMLWQSIAFNLVLNRTFSSVIAFTYILGRWSCSTKEIHNINKEKQLGNIKISSFG